MSSSSSPPVVPQHCSTVSLLYELLKCEEEPCRVWLRDEMNQIPDPLIDSLFHRLICSSSSSVVAQSRPTVSELCEVLEGEKVQMRMVLRAEMDRVLNTLFDRLTNKLRMTNLDESDREEDGDERALADQVESPNHQPSTSSFNPVAHEQHSNGDEVQLNTVEMIEIKEEVEDGEETRVIDMETLTEDYQIKREIKEDDEMNDQNEDWVKREIKEEEEDGEMVQVKEEDEEEEDGSAEIDDIEDWAEDNQAGEDECRSVVNASLDTTQAHPTGQSQNASNSNESIEEGGANLSREQLIHTLNEPNEVTTVTQSADLLSPSTSTAQDSIRTALDQQAMVPTRQKATKRKQPTSKRSAKRSKQTVQNEDGEDEEGEAIANEDREELKIKILHLNCTQLNCNVKLDSIALLNDHFRTVHRLLPLQCFATNCNARFDNRQQISAHNKSSHSRNTRFMCSVCSEEYGSQHNAYLHWYKNHLTGQFECNLVDDCGEVTDTRGKMETHQNGKHQSNKFHCTQPGCTASFAFKDRLKAHQLTHLNSYRFHCNWPHCSTKFKLRSNLVSHIRTKHFGLPRSVKAQKAKNIVDLRDPNEFVRVVVDE